MRAVTDQAGTRPPQRSGLQVIVSLAPYLWPKGNMGARIRVVIAVVFMFLAKFAAVYVPILYGRTVDALTTPGNLAIALPLMLILGYGIARIGAAGFGEVRDALFASVSQRAVRLVALRTYEHLHRVSLRFHLDRQTGGLSRVIDRGDSACSRCCGSRCSTWCRRRWSCCWLPRSSGACSTGGTRWSRCPAVVIYVGFTSVLAGRRGRYRRTLNETDNEASSKSLDSLLNYETVKYFGNEAHEAARYDKALARYERAAVRVQVSLNMLNLGSGRDHRDRPDGDHADGGQSMAAGEMTVGSFVLINTYLIQLYQPLNFLGMVYMTIKQGLVDMEQMFTLMGVEAEINDKPGAPALVAECRRAARCVSKMFISAIGRTARSCTASVSRFRPASALAIVGPTGSGKSTISRLLFRFYDVTGGRILIDGQDIRDVTQASVRAAIGVVPQDTVLFNDTIRYNIGYGKPSAAQDEIEQAARLAQVHDFVPRLPEGYDTMVGERGLKLSGGEKQRVAIARTILKDPRILILDEATSALDTRTEQEIQGAFRAVMSHRTTLVIAHRLSTVIDADEIIVLDDGVIEERGTHASLLARDGLYARLWAMQADDPVLLIHRFRHDANREAKRMTSGSEQDRPPN